MITREWVRENGDFRYIVVYNARESHTKGSTGRPSKPIHGTHVVDVAIAKVFGLSRLQGFHHGPWSFGCQTRSIGRRRGKRWQVGPIALVVPNHATSIVRCRGSRDMARNSRGSVDIVFGRMSRTQSVFVVVGVARIGAADASISTKFAIVPSSSLIHKGMFLRTVNSSFYRVPAMSGSRSRRPNRVVRRIFHSDTRTIFVSVVIYGSVVPRRFSVSKGISSHGVHRRVARNGFVSPTLLVSFFE